MNGLDHRALIIGFNGGVGRAVVSLLEQSKPGAKIREGLGALFLADKKPPRVPLKPNGFQLLPPLKVEDGADLAQLVREYELTQVIDLSSTDTIDCTQICDDHDVSFLCTSIEEWPSSSGTIPTDEAIAQLKPPHRPELTRRRHLVGSGANPGIVNALVFAALEEMGKRAGVKPTIEALGIHSILITEEDTTHEPGVTYDDDVFPMTWSPEHCLEELFEPRAFIGSHGEVIDLGHRPTERFYRARCGDRMIDGMAVPHEETKTLLWRFPNVEIAFLYRIPEAARAALARFPERDRAEQWRTHRLFPPTSTKLEGKDRLGVLLCSERFGELWMGFDTDVSLGRPHGTNATELQVAAGVIAGWKQLDGDPGISFVEDLEWRPFLEVVSTVLGTPQVVYDPEAKAQLMADRLVR